jgi:hypothetical protein
MPLPPARNSLAPLIALALAVLSPAVAPAAEGPLRHEAELVRGVLPPGDSCAAALERATEVTYEFHAPEGNGWGGTTFYHFDYRYDFNYRYWVVQRPDGAHTRVAVTVVPSVHVWHVVRLPRGRNDADPVYRRVRRHELDHVAVSFDERPSLLFRHLATHLPELDLPPPARTKAAIEKAIRDTIGACAGAVTTLIQSSYDRLDELTNHGVVGLPDRAAFFESLYTEEGLVRSRFPYLAAVEPLLVTPRYRNAPRPRCDD